MTATTSGILIILSTALARITRARSEATRRPLVLVWPQEFVPREEALTPERQIKGWSRAKKEALIRGDWKQIHREAWGTKNPLLERLR